MSNHNGRKPETLEVKFWRHVSRGADDQCWLWNGYTNAAGYGILTLYSNSIRVARLRVHRVCYELLKGPIPEGLELDHLCRVRNCVNPNHLEAVTTRENVLRGIGPAARYARRTRCDKGHPFDGIFKGYRRCLTCHRQQEFERHHREHPDAQIRTKRRGGY